MVAELVSLKYGKRQSATSQQTDQKLPQSLLLIIIIIIDVNIMIEMQNYKFESTPLKAL